MTRLKKRDLIYRALKDKGLSPWDAMQWIKEKADLVQLGYNPVTFLQRKGLDLGLADGLKDCTVD